MRSKILSAASILLLVCFSFHAQSQMPQNWTEKQLMEPSDLAATISANKDVPLILSVGPAALIPGSIQVGMANSAEGISKLKTQLKDVPKNKKLVIYCGCCPFDHCPNVRPAIEVLKDLKFSNYYLLDLSHNIRKDWIDKGYPTLK